MAKPKIFVSSTYYDLRHIRANLELFISELGYDAVLFENGSVAFDPSNALDESCYEEIKSCDIFVLIIGGRYGAIASGDHGQTKSPSAKKIADVIASLNSITRKEYITAREKDVPIYIFVERSVASEFRTYQKNKNLKKIKYAHVDNIGIFQFLDEIYGQQRNNLVKEFERASDIENWLREQWAGLFAQFIRTRGAQKELNDLSAQLSELRAINEGLKNYSEVIIKKLNVPDADNVIDKTDKKIIQAREDDFLTSPMIGWLIGQASSLAVNIHIRSWAAKFHAAKTVEEFLSSVGFDESQVNDIVSKKGHILERDFAVYQRRYSGVVRSMRDVDFIRNSTLNLVRPEGRKSSTSRSGSRVSDAADRGSSAKIAKKEKGERALGLTSEKTSGSRAKPAKPTASKSLSSSPKKKKERK